MSRKKLLLILVSVVLLILTVIPGAREAIATLYYRLRYEYSPDDLLLLEALPEERSKKLALTGFLHSSKGASWWGKHWDEDIVKFGLGRLYEHKYIPSPEFPFQFLVYTHLRELPLRSEPRRFRGRMIFYVKVTRSYARRSAEIVRRESTPNPSTSVQKNETQQILRLRFTKPVSRAASRSQESGNSDLSVARSSIDLSSAMVSPLPLVVTTRIVKGPGLSFYVGSELCHKR